MSLKETPTQKCTKKLAEKVPGSVLNIKGNSYCATLEKYLKKGKLPHWEDILKKEKRMEAATLGRYLKKKRGKLLPHCHWEDI